MAIGRVRWMLPTSQPIKRRHCIIHVVDHSTNSRPPLSHTSAALKLSCRFLKRRQREKLTSFTTRPMTPTMSTLAHSAIAMTRGWHRRISITP